MVKRVVQKTVMQHSATEDAQPLVDGHAADGASLHLAGATVRAESHMPAGVERNARRLHLRVTGLL